MGKYDYLVPNKKKDDEENQATSSGKYSYLIPKPSQEAAAEQKIKETKTPQEASQKGLFDRVVDFGKSVVKKIANFDTVQKPTEEKPVQQPKSSGFDLGGREPAPSATITPEVKESPQYQQNVQSFTNTANAIDTFFQNPIDTTYEGVFQALGGDKPGSINSKIYDAENKYIVSNPNLNNRFTQSYTKGLLNSFLASSDGVQKVFSAEYAKPSDKPGEQAVDTVGDALGQTTAFLAGGFGLKGIVGAKALMPTLFTLIGQTSQTSDVTALQRIQKAPVDAFSGWLFTKVPMPKNAKDVKNLLKGTGAAGTITAAQGFLNSIIAGMPPDEAAKMVGKMAVIGGLFHVAAIGTGLGGKKLIESKVKTGNVEMTPEQVRINVENTNLANTELGNHLLEQAAIAQAQGKNLSIEGIAAQRSKVAKTLGLKTPEGISVEVKLVNPQEIRLLSENGVPVQDGQSPSVTPELPGGTFPPRRENLRVDTSQYSGVKTASAGVDQNGEGSMFIEFLPEGQKKGQGTQLVKQIEGQLGEKGVTKIHIDSFIEAQPFWEKMGYTIVPGAVAKHGLIKMEKDLAPESPVEGVSSEIPPTEETPTVQANRPTNEKITAQTREDTLSGKREDQRLTEENNLTNAKNYAENNLSEDATADTLVTVYRASTDPELKTGEFVTLDKANAERYLDQREGSKVMTAQVPLKDLVFSGGLKSEFVFSPKEATRSIDSEKYTNVELSFNRNPEASTDMGSRFGQDVEPAGKYINLVSDSKAPTPPGWESGTVKFKNPLVIDWGEGYKSGKNWKNRLSQEYGGKTGSELSKAIVNAGYDGIITLEGGQPSEAVSLQDLKAPTTQGGFESQLQEQFGKTIETATIKEVNEALEQSKEAVSYDSEVAQQILKKASSPASAVNLRELESGRPALYYGGINKGIFTDGYLMISDKTVAKKLSDELVARQVKVETKSIQSQDPSISFAQAEKTAKANIKAKVADLETKYPSQESIDRLLNTESSGAEAKIVGFERSGGINLVYLNDGKTTTVVDGNRLGFMQKYLPEATIHLSSETTPVIFKNGSGKVAGILMPIKADKPVPVFKSKSVSDTDVTRKPTRKPAGLASTGSDKIGNFEKRVTPEQQKAKDFKLFERVQALNEKYGERTIGEKHVSRGAAGVYHRTTGNIRTTGINNFSVNVHEIAHSIDNQFKIAANLYKVKGTAKNGNPLYETATAGLRSDMTDLYTKYYPTGKANHKVETRMLEGFATLVQKYIEKPLTMTEEFPDLVEAFLTPGGKYYEPKVGEFIKDASKVVEEYQGLSNLDKVGARVVNKTLKSGKKDFLNPFEKLRVFIEDDIYALEKLGKEAGVDWTSDDPSLWLRQYSRGGGIYANNILNDKNGYWTLDETGEAVKKSDHNWKNLMDRLEKDQNLYDFGDFLVARDQFFQWKELDKLKEAYLEKKPILDLGEKFGIKPSDLEQHPEIAKELGIDIKDIKKIIAEAKAAKQAYEDQAQYLENNGFLRQEVTGAYLENEVRFSKEAELYDKLVRLDLELLHNPQVQLVGHDQFKELASKEGYASMKRAFYDELIGDAKQNLAGLGRGGANKASSLKRRSGGQQEIINPVLNAMVNHIEITKKSLKQIVYNKMGKAASSPNISEPLKELMQIVDLRSFVDDQGKVTYPQEKDPDILMARINYKKVPVIVDKLFKRTIDDTLTYQNMNIFEYLLVSANRVFTFGTTGGYAPFALVNFPADQWNAVVNTRNDYTPLLDQIKLLSAVITKSDPEMAKYWHEWQVMGGDRMSLFQAQLKDADDALRYITRETSNLKKAINVLNSGIDKLAIVSKYSETASRFSEYARARQNGKPQVVALEEAGRITAPFHHIGAWKFGDKASGKFLIRSIPFANASLQVLSQTIRTAETPKGRRRLFIVMLAAAAAYLASMGMVALYGSDDQKEQYKDLNGSDIANFINFPAVGGNNLIRVKVSNNISIIGTLLAMTLGQQLMGIKYRAEDYQVALTEWIPRQLNLFMPVEMFFSWFNPLIKIPTELMLNVKDYPRVSPIESISLQNLEPRARFNESTSMMAKALGDQFNLSPIKIDYLLNGLLGRQVGFLTIKPRIFNPTGQINREYFFTMGRRVQNFYDDKQQIEQRYNALKAKRETDVELSDKEELELDVIQDKRSNYKRVEKLLKRLRETDPDQREELREIRSELIPLLEETQ